MPDTFTTPDATLAATLIVSGVVLMSSRVDPPGTGRVVFAFPDDAKTRRVSAQFWAGKAAVEPRAYDGAFKRVHQEIRDAQDNGGNA